MKWYLLIIGITTGTIWGQQFPTETLFFNNLYDNYKQTPLFLPEISIDNFTISSLFYKRNEGNWHLGQQAKKQHSIGLRTYGIYQHNKTTFFGELGIKRIYDDAKKWNLSAFDVSPEGLMPIPHYYAVSKGSKWNSLLFDSRMGFIQPIIFQKWDFSLSASYNLSQKFRTEYDPRPTIIYNNLNLNLSTGFKFLQKHKISIGMGGGFYKTNTRITFSDTFTQTPYYYEKYYRWIFGYGTFQNAAFPTAKDYNTFLESHIGYHYSDEKNKWFVTIQHKKNKIDTYNNNSDTNNPNENVIAQFKTTEVIGNLSFFRVINPTQKLYINLKGNRFSAENFLIKQNGKNYASTQNFYEIMVALLNNTQKTIYDLGISLSLNEVYQKDALANTLTDRTFIKLSPYLSKEFVLNNGSIIPKLMFSYQQKIHNKLENNNLDYHKTIEETDYAAKTIRLFYDEVVYRDFHYFNRNHYEINLGTDFKFPLQKNRDILVGLSSTYKTTLQKSNENRYFLSAHITLKH